MSYTDIYNCGYVDASYGQLHCTQCDMDGMQRIVERVPGGYIVEGMANVGSTTSCQSSAYTTINASNQTVQTNMTNVLNILAGIIYTAILNNLPTQNNTPLCTTPLPAGATCNGQACNGVTIYKTCTLPQNTVQNIQPASMVALNIQLNDASSALSQALTNLIPSPSVATTSQVTLASITKQIKDCVFGFTDWSNVAILNNIMTALAGSQAVIINNGSSTNTYGVDAPSGAQIVANQLACDGNFMGITTALTSNNQTQVAASSSSSGLSWWVWLIIALVALVLIGLAVWYIRKRRAASLKLTYATSL